MAYINYDCCYSICKNYEILDMNYSDSNKILLKNTVGTEYLKILNNLDVVESTLQKCAREVMTYFKDNINNIENIDFFEILEINTEYYKELEKYGFSEFTSDMLYNDFIGSFKSYVKSRALEEKEYNNYEKYITNIDDIMKNINNCKDEKEIDSILEDNFSYFTKNTSINEKIKLLEDIKKNKQESLRMCRHFIEEDNKKIEEIRYMYLNILITIFNSISFYNKEQLIMPLKTDTTINNSLKNFYKREFENTNYLEIPRSQMNYEIVKGNELIISEEIQKIASSKDKEIVTSYDIENIKDFCCVNIKYFIDNKIRLSCCTNCGKYFIPDKRSDTKYCNNISPQNPNKTCKEISAQTIYRESLKSDLIKKEYTKTDQYYRTRKNRAKNEKEQEKITKRSNKFKEDYKRQSKKHKKGELTEEEFIEWIKNQKDLK